MPQFCSPAITHGDSDAGEMASIDDSFKIRLGKMPAQIVPAPLALCDLELFNVKPSLLSRWARRRAR
jgi:hypothetical protein